MYTSSVSISIYRTYISVCIPVYLYNLYNLYNFHNLAGLVRVVAVEEGVLARHVDPEPQQLERPVAHQPVPENKLLLLLYILLIIYIYIYIYIYALCRSYIDV